MQIKNINFKREDLTIVGDLLIPDSCLDKEKYPILIYSHGFGSTRHESHGYIQDMVHHGYAVYAFDFCGGGIESESDGSTLDMSVLTEKKDLEAVLKGIQSLPCCEKVILWGASQGGFVSAIVANDHIDEVEALILYYPAFVLQDDAKKAYPNIEDVPKSYPIMDMEVGRVYNVDARSFDVYESIGNYTKPVLIIHGTEDPIVPISYTQKAAKIYKNVKYMVLEGAGHGFDGKDEKDAVQETKEFLDQVV